MADFKLHVDTSGIEKLFVKLDKLVVKINTALSVLDKGLIKNMEASMGALSRHTKSIDKTFTKTREETTEILKNIEKIKDTTGKVTTLWARISFVATALVSYKIFDIITTSITDAVEESKLLETSFVELKSLMNDIPDGSKIAKMFTDKEVELSVKYGHSLKDIADSAYNTVSALKKNKDSLIALDNAMKLAEVTNSTTNTTTKLINRTLNAFNLNVQESARVSETWFKVIQEGDLRLEEMGGSIGKLIASAGSAGISFGDLASAYGTMVKVLPAKQATTALTRIITKFKEMPEVMEKVQKVGLLETIKDFNDLTGEQIKDIMGSSKAIAGMSVIFQKQNDIIRIRNKMLANSSYLEEAFTEKMATEAKKRDVLIQEIKTNMRNIGTYLNGLQKVSLMAFDGLTTGAGKAIIVIGSLTIAVRQFFKLWSLAKEGALFAGTTSVLGAIVIAGTALGLVLYKLKNSFKSIDEKITDIKAKTDKLFSGATDSNHIAQEFDNLANSIVKSNTVMAEYEKKLHDISKTSFGWVDATQKVRKAMAEESAILKENKDKLALLNGAYEYFNANVKDGKIDMDKFADSLKRSGVYGDDLTKMLDLFSRQNTVNILSKMRNGIQTLNGALSILKLRFKLGTKTSDDYSNAIGKLVAKYKELSQKTELSAKEQKELLGLQILLKNVNNNAIDKRTNELVEEGSLLLSKNVEIKRLATMTTEELAKQVELQINAIKSSSKSIVEKHKAIADLLEMIDKFRDKTAGVNDLINRGNLILKDKSILVKGNIGETRLYLTELDGEISRLTSINNRTATQTNNLVKLKEERRKIQEGLEKNNRLYYESNIFLDKNTEAIKTLKISKGGLLKEIDKMILSKQKEIKENKDDIAVIRELSNEIRSLESLRKKVAGKSEFFSFLTEGLEDIKSLVGSFYDFLAIKANTTYDNLIAKNDKLRRDEINRINGMSLTEEQKRKAIQKINDKYDKKAKDAEKKKNKELGEEKKRVALIDAGINYAEGLIRIWSQHAAHPLYAEILSGLLTSVYFAESAVISKTKYAKGGVLKGNSHDNGGIQITPTEEVEGGETILTSAVSRNPILLAIASFINTLAGGNDFAGSTRGGGISVPKMEADSSSQAILDYLSNFEPVVLTGVTDRGIYRAWRNGKPQGAF
jgi:hypothetical protein